MTRSVSNALTLALLLTASRAGAEPEPAAPAEDVEDPVEVTVVGTPLSQTAGSAQVISNDQLERKEHDDPHAVLAQVPGVQVRGEDGFGLRPNISIRGVNPDRSKKVALMEDGIPFGPAPYSAPAAYYFPLMTRMTGVRVIKGPAAISYGPQTIAGAIDLVTRPIPAEGDAGIDLAVGQYGYGKAHGYAGQSNVDGGFLIEGVHLRSDGFKALPSGADTGFYRNEWMWKGVYHPDPTSPYQNELRLKLTYSEELSNETYLGLTDADFRSDPLQRYGASELDQMKNHRTSIVASHTIHPTRSLTIDTDVYRHDYYRIWRKVNGFRGASIYDVLREPDSPQNAVYHSILTGELDASGPAEALLIGPNEREFVSQGIQTRLRFDGQTGPVSHRAEYGFRIHNDSIARRHSQDAFQYAGGNLLPEGSPTVVTAFNRAETTALAAYVTDAVSYRRLTVTPGVRFETMRLSLHDRITDTRTSRMSHVVIPGIGLFQGLHDHFGVLAGMHRGFSPVAPGSDDSTTPELSTNYEAGARYANGKARAEVIGFYDDYDNLTDVCTVSSGCVDANLDRQFDAGSARMYGVEVYAAHEIPAGLVRVPVNAAYTLTRAEFRSTFQSEDPIFGSVESGDEVPYVPDHQAHFDVGVENDTVGANVGLHYTSAMREQAGSEPLDEALTTDEQFLLDAGAFYQVLEPLRLYCNVRNLLDAQYVVARRPYGARPNAPRWVQVGVKLSF